MKSNGYPRPHAELKSGAVVFSSYKQTAISNNPLQRICDRCGKEYQVNKDGIALKEEECVNHWGRLYNMRSKYLTCFKLYVNLLCSSRVETVYYLSNCILFESKCNNLII